jgi:hypothetical protein
MFAKLVFRTCVFILGIHAVAGCACPSSESTVLYLEQETFEQMLALYGERGVPLDDCVLLCTQPELDGNGGGASSSGAEAVDEKSERVVIGCELTSINFEQGGVDCTFATECES